MAKIRLNNVRLSFPSLWKAETVNGEGEPAFSANFIIDPADPQVATIEKAIEATAAEKWGAKAEAQLKAIRAAGKSALHDGNLKTYDGYEGMLYVSARNKIRPTVVDANKAPLVEEDGKPYSGCYVNASIEFWAQDNNYGKRINCTLLGVQFFRDGEAFSGSRTGSPDDFDDVSVDDIL